MDPRGALSYDHNGSVAGYAWKLGEFPAKAQIQIFVPGKVIPKGSIGLAIPSPSSNHEQG